MSPRQETNEAHAIDTGLVLSAGLLIALGVVMSYSATAPLALDAKIPPLFVDHVTGLALGLAGAWLVARVPVAVLRRAALPAYGVSLVLLAATLAFGVEVNGAQRWLALPGLGFRFQPSELAKCATILAAAAWLARKDARRELSTRRSVETAALAIGPAGLLLLQPDLGNAVVLVALVALMLFVAGTPWPRFVLPGAAGVVLVGVYILNNDYAMRRVTGFLDPFREARGAGWQLVQSYVAFGQGSVFGQGFGNGRQKLAYLPEAHTDFVLSVVAEELGLLGVLVVIGSFAALWLAGTRVARRATDRFEMLLAFGMVSLLTVPAFLNASVVMGLVPTKGLTLPFLSYGRTSLVASCLALGLLLGVARRHPAPRSVPGAALGQEGAWQRAG
ncbi:MAG: putative lipid II flippase FtsW [Spirochaetaceae bacterium]|nr:putative lipid II flippase FtsW [Myxococcales bacterium]MCB9724561.1 putative lipid II flippase FtsW [Spirochaetaceae bacterium]